MLITFLHTRTRFAARCDYTRAARHISLPVLKRHMAMMASAKDDSANDVGTLSSPTAPSVVLVDLRRRSEQMVSHIPGAIRVSYPEEGKLPEAKEVMERWDIPPAVRDAGLVVTYCTAGWRGSVASTVLERRLGRPVYNLGGALLAWYNDGGTVVNDDGEEVEMMHPCAVGWVQYIQRRNDFALPLP